MITLNSILIAAFLFAGLSGSAMDSKMTLELAEKIAAAALERAEADNWTVVVVILDAGGHPVLLKRVDGTQLGSIEVATKKAKSAVLFKRSTKSFQDGVAAGNAHILALPGAMPVEGGLPIVVDGVLIGAIGVSGVTAAQDGIIAQAGIDAILN